MSHHNVRHNNLVRLFPMDRSELTSRADLQHLPLVVRRPRTFRARIPGKRIHFFDELPVLPMEPAISNTDECS